MSTPEVFQFTDYRAFLKARIEAHPEKWGLITKLAKAAKCQRPYLSKVLAEDAHLTSAQAYGIARFWGLSEERLEYFLILLEIEKSASAEYREHLQRKARQLREKHQDLSRRVSRPVTGEQDRNVFYYSSWLWTAIHIATSIPELQTVRALSERFSVSSEYVKHILETLEENGFVSGSDGRWKFRAHDQHLSRHSPLVSFHHSNWRQRAVLHSQSSSTDSTHFTVVQSLSRKDYEQIKDLVLDAIERISRIAGPSKEEELMCFTCDLFKP